MKRVNKIGLLILSSILIISVLAYTSGCAYRFKDVSIPDTIKTVKVNFLENKARYVNPALSPRLTDKLRQKIVGQTRLNQTNGDNADWEISGYVSEYNLSTSAISGQREAGNRLTVAVHITVTGQKRNTPLDFDISRNFEFAASQSLQQAEAQLADEMIRSLTDDIFNRLFSDW